MCDPLTIAGAALSLGGVAANSIGQSQAAAASNRAAEAERARQSQLRQEAAQVQAHSNSLYENFADKQASRATDLGTYLKAQQTPAQGATATIEAPAGAAAGSGNITQQGEAAERGKADAYAGSQADALGTMRSFGDLLGTQNLLQARDAGQIGQIGNFMKGSASVLPLELNAASHAGDTFKTLGGLAGGLGKVGVAAGTSGAGGSIASLFGGGSATGANVALPSFASPVAGPTQSAPLSLASAFSSTPSFASSPYRV